MSEGKIIYKRIMTIPTLITIITAPWDFNMKAPTKPVFASDEAAFDAANVGAQYILEPDP